MVTSSYARILTGHHPGDITKSGAVISVGGTLASAFGWASAFLRSHATLDLPEGGTLVSTQTPEVNRLAVMAWVMANTRTGKVELWTAELCPSHNPAIPAANGCVYSEAGGHISHPVQNCSCWCAGVSSVRFVCVVSTFPVAHLDDAVRNVEVTPFDGQTPLNSVVEALTMVDGTDEPIVGVWVSLVAQGMDPHRALPAAAAIAGRPPQGASGS